MNPLLFLYLNFVRGPQLNAQRRKKEEEERLAREAADPSLAVAAAEKKKADTAKAQLTSCKKCEIQVLDTEINENFGLCNACASNPWALVTPFVIFQLGGIVVALVVLVYRYLNGLPLV